MKKNLFRVIKMIILCCLVACTTTTKRNVTVTGIALLTEDEKEYLHSEENEKGGWLIVQTIADDSTKAEFKAYILKEDLAKATFPFPGILTLTSCFCGAVSGEVVPVINPGNQLVTKKPAIPKKTTPPVVTVHMVPKVIPHSVSNTIYIPQGGSLCGTLKMTKSEALGFAKKCHMKYWYKGKRLIVLVHPNDAFHQIDGVWEINK